MMIRSVESTMGSSEQPALYALAEKLCNTPGGFDRYDYAKCVWLGAPNRQQRLSGDHPWPTRERNGQEYVYAIPVFAAVDSERQTVLYIGKDHWKAVEDPDGWLVAERNLLWGEEVEHRVLRASVDAAHDLRLSLAPAGYDNQSPVAREAIRTRPLYMQTVLSGRLDERYNLQRATLRYGMDGESTQYEDFEALESMIIVIQQLRAARAEREHAQQREMIVGQHGVFLSAAA